MNLYRNKLDNQLYIIEHLIKDVHHLNNNENAGVYAVPYNWCGVTMKFLNKNSELCMRFIDENFEKVASL